MKTILLNEYYSIMVRMEDSTHEKLVQLYEDVFFKNKAAAAEVVKHLYNKLENDLADVLDNSMIHYEGDTNEVIQETDYFILQNENTKSYDDDIFILCTIKFFDGDVLVIDINDVTLGHK